MAGSWVKSASPSFNFRVFVLGFDILLFAFLAYQSVIYFGLVDDACISFRYARNLAWGDGLTYNAGEYHEGISNLLWTLCLAGLYRAGFSMRFAAHIMTMLCLLFGAWLVRAASLKQFADRPFLSRLPLAMTVLFTAFLTDSGNMLEGSLVFFCCALMLYGAVRRAPLVLGVAAALFTANRPEGAVIAGFIAAWTFWEFRRARISLNGFLFVAAMAAFAVGGITLFRALYFGDVIPSTVRAKALASKIMEGNDHVATRAGVALVRNYYQPLLPLLALLATGAMRRQNASLAGLMLVLLCFNAALVIKNGGDWLGFRLLSPYYTLLAFGSLLGCAALPRRFCLQEAAVGVCVGTALYNMNVGALAQRSADFLHQPDYRTRHLVQSRDMAHDNFIPAYKHLCPEDFYYPDDKVIVENGGMPAWMLERAYVIEQFGLTHPALHRPNTHIQAFLTMGVANTPELLAMQPTYSIHSLFSTALYDIPFLHEAYHAHTKHFMATISFGTDSFGQIGEVFLVRDDRATLPLFVLSYGFVAPAADLYRMPADAPELLTRWHAEPWRQDDGSEITAGWHRWDELSRLSWRIPLVPGVVRLSRPLPDAHPLLLLVALPPQSRIHGQVTASVQSPGIDAALLETLPLEENLSESLATCAAALAPPPHETGAELVLEIESEHSGELLLTIYRWTAGGTPVAPERYLQHSAEQRRRRLKRLGLTQDSDIHDSFYRGSMAFFEHRRALLRQAMPLRRAIRKQPDSVALCRQLTNLYTDHDDKELLLREWEVLAGELPFHPLPQAHLALARARHGDLSGTMEACANAYCASRGSLDFVLSVILTPAQQFLDPAAMLQWIANEQGKDFANPFLMTCAAAIRVDIIRRQAQSDIGAARESALQLREELLKFPEMTRLHADIREQPDSYTQRPEAAKDVQWRLVMAEGYALFATGRAAEARAAFDRAESLAPGRSEIWMGLAMLHAHEGNITEALAICRRVIEAVPHDYGAYEQLSDMYVRQGDLEGLVAEWQRAVKAHPERALAWFCFGLALERRGDWDAARVAYERALELDPDAEGTREALARVMMEQTRAEAPTATHNAGEDSAEH